MMASKPKVRIRCRFEVFGRLCEKGCERGLFACDGRVVRDMFPTSILSVSFLHSPTNESYLLGRIVLECPSQATSLEWHQS